MLSRVPLILFDVMWVKSNGKKVKLHSCGSFLDESKIEKIINRPKAFEFEWAINFTWLEEGLQLFERLIVLNDSRPQDLIGIDEWRIEFINWASPGLWYGDIEDIRFLDFVAFIMLILNISSEDFYEGFDRLPEEVQTRNVVISSTIVLFALMVGYTDINLLKDMFKTFLFVDYVYCDENWTNEEKELLSKINSEGLSQLNTVEREFIKEKYKKANLKARKSILEKIENTFVEKYLDWSLENFEGTGLFHQVNMHEMSDLDLLVLLALQGIKYEKDTLEKRIERRLNDLVVENINLSDRLRRVISSSIQVASERNNNFLKISGL